MIINPPPIMKLINCAGRHKSAAEGDPSMKMTDLQQYRQKSKPDSARLAVPFENCLPEGWLADNDTSDGGGLLTTTPSMGGGSGA